VWRSPVLQYSLVLFSFPFLIHWFFLGFRNAPKWMVLASTCLLSITSTTTLILVRQHFRIFSDSPYAAMVRVAQNEVLRAGPERTLVIFDAPRPQVEFHVMRRGLERITAISWARQQDPNDILEQLADTRWTRVVLGTTNGCLEERVAQVRAQFPYLVHVEDHVEGQVHVFTRNEPEDPIVDRTALWMLSPGRRAGQVDVNNALTLWNDTDSRTSSWDMVGHEFGISGTYTLAGPELHVEDLYEVEMDVSHIPTGTDLALVVELRDARDELLLYRATPASIDSGTVVVAFSPSWVGAEDAPLYVKMYVQNRTKGPARIHALRLFRRDQNPVRNALLAPVVRLGHLP